MKRSYETPFAEMLEFNYSNTIVASPIVDEHGDVGHGVSQKDKGCDKIPGHNNPNPHGQGPHKTTGNGSGKCN